MHIIVTESYDASAAFVADMIAELINKKPDCKLGLATGGTPVPIYKKLIGKNAAGEVDFAQVRTVNLDEYCGLAGDHDQSYRYFMDTNVFDHVNINTANTFVASGLGDPAANAAELDARVAEGGPCDLQLLGIGNNGHIAFNEAGDCLKAESHIETLTESTIRANARFFESEADVPRHALTMGIGTILSARRILLIATGEAKAKAIATVLSGKLTTSCPASLLNLHSDVTILCDRAAVSLCDPSLLATL